MQRNHYAALTLATAALSASTVFAQAPTLLVQDGDNYPGFGDVIDVYNVDVNDSGSWIVEGRVDNAGTTSDVTVVDGVVIVQSGVTPLTAAGVPMGSVWSSLSECWQNNSNQILLGGIIGTSTNVLVLLDTDAAGNITGEALLAIEFTTMPQPTGPVVVMVGETWSFQCWFRDTSGGAATSNFTDGSSLTFQ